MRYLCLLVMMLVFFPVQAEEERRLKPGDSLMVLLPGEPDFDQPFQLDNQGKIRLPEAGRVALRGKTLEQAKVTIKLALSSVYLNLDQFDLELEAPQLLIRVLGYVDAPGEVLLPADGNVQMAIEAAGGLRPGAQLDRLQVQRGDEIIPFDYKAYLDSGNDRLLPPLKSEDRLFVPASPLTGNVEVNFDARSLIAGGDGAGKREAITLFGEVRNPGTFSIKGEMTLVDALMRAEGVTRYGDVSHIRVITENVPYLFDLKSYLDEGESKTLPPVGPGTLVYVPIQVDVVSNTQRTVYVMGEVQQPGAYETGDQVTFLDLLANAGGPTRFAETRNIRLLRQNQSVVEVDLLSYTESRQSAPLPAIEPGDVIFVPEKTDVNEKSWLKIPSDRAIKIVGAMNKPGRYEWDDAMSFLDLFAHAEGPKQHANLAEIEILKESGDKYVFDLDKFIKQGGSYAALPDLEAGDTVIVNELPWDPTDNKSSWIRQGPESSIYVFGQVESPGRYAFTSQLSFLDILAAADGPTDEADLGQIRITHRDGSQARVTQLNLARYFETGDESVLPKVLPGDTIFLPQRDRQWLEKPAEQVVRLMGAVNKPGRYSFDDTMNLLDLLAEAGGPKENAYIEKIIVVQHSCCEPQARVFDLKEFVLRPNYAQIPVLRPGDTVYVPDEEQSNWHVFINGVRDALSIVALVALGGAI
ncbi:SLBB domain-containing protein [Ferrimonas sp. YFM]|uniref:SLBB domain-containing protein n=1 Tax=Ferrimonas sp. YFM TaxID=3028878 RepID=UPI0025744776|nr:SLBB domain-containing protein [Ferrimonas sp. YFM]BDY04931.1 sugar ABC transporter substrate-binding protein [Ferrimonas sp. YFM]